PVYRPAISSSVRCPAWAGPGPAASSRCTVGSSGGRGHIPLRRRRSHKNPTVRKSKTRPTSRRSVTCPSGTRAGASSAAGRRPCGRGQAGLGPGSGARGAYQGGCVAHAGALGVLLRHDLRRRDAELDAPVLDARLVAGLRAAGRAVLDAAVGEAERAAVPRAGDAVVGDRALAQGAAHVAAGRGDGVHLSVLAVEQDLHAVRIRGAVLAFAQLLVRQDRGPVLGL